MTTSLNRHSQEFAQDQIKQGHVVLAVITLLNLRGLGDAARRSCCPPWFFIVGLIAILAIGCPTRWRCTPHH